MAKERYNPVATTQGEACRMLGISTRQFREYISEGCPGERGRYDMEEIISWFIGNVWRKRVRHGVVLSDPDSEIEDDSIISPMLERLREEKWRRERIKRRLEDASAIPVEDVHRSLGILAGVLRGFGDQMQRAFGPTAADLHDEMINTVLERIHEEFGQDPGSEAESA